MGTSWARLLCESVRKQGRAVAGGWPGTMVEARARIARHLDDQLGACGMPPLRKDELDGAASATYAQAKKEWLEAERSTKAAMRASLARD